MVGRFGVAELTSKASTRRARIGPGWRAVAVGLLASAPPGCSMVATREAPAPVAGSAVPSPRPDDGGSRPRPRMAAPPEVAASSRADEPASRDEAARQVDLSPDRAAAAIAPKDEPKVAGGGAEPGPGVDVAPPSAMTMGEAVAYGLRFNPRLAREAARVERARAGEMIAFAPFLPNVGLKFQNSAFNIPVLPGGEFVPASLEAGVYDFSITELGVQYTLADFGRRAGRLGQSRAATRLQALLLDRARQAVAFEVVEAYLQVLAAEARLGVRGEALERARTIREDVGTRRQQGRVEAEANLRAGAGVTRSEVEVVAARQAISDARSYLDLALGRPRCGPLGLVDERRRPEATPTLDECLEAALRGRAEIGAAREQVASAASGEQSARGDYLPRVSVRAGLIRADAPRELHNWITAAGVVIDQEVFAGGRIRGGLKSAQAVAAEAFAGLREIVNQVTHQVNIAFDAIATARERVRLGEVEVGQSREALRVVLVRYRNGDAILSDVITTETAYVAARVALVTARYEELDALARLEYAQGGDQHHLLDELARAPAPPPAPDEEQPLPPIRGPLPAGVGDPEPDTPSPIPIPAPPPPDDRPAAGLPPALPEPG